MDKGAALLRNEDRLYENDPFIQHNFRSDNTKGNA